MALNIGSISRWVGDYIDSKPKICYYNKNPQSVIG